MEPIASAEAQLDALLDAAVDAIIVINWKGEIETFNQAARQMFGYRGDEVIGKNVNRLMPAPYAENHDQYLHNYLESRIPRIIGIGRQVQARRKDGEIFPIELSVGEVLKQQKPHFVGIIRDISDRMRAEQEAHEIRERLAHITRLGVMGEMASGIAHEINQPLTAITNYAQASVRLLQNNAADTGEFIEILGKISQQAQRAGEVIRRLRSFIRKRESHREAVNIRQLILDTLAMTETDTRMLNCTTRVSLDDSYPKIVADGVQIQQVILNLIRNALDAMEDINRPEIYIGVKTLIKEGMLEIEITDNGPGLPPERETELFKPFFTTKTSGMGMGLAISQTIINSHGGRLWFTRTESGGSNFHFTLPYAEEELAES
jgi:two-component system sensor kinase FixL